MGNTALAPDFPVDKVAEITQNVLEIFAPVYVKAHGIATVRRLHREDEAARLGASTLENPDGFKLKAPPVGTQPLMMGYMEKRGEGGAGWKKRFFVARNKADNFCIEYFESKEMSSKRASRKGSIEPCGYLVRSVKDEDEVKEHGENAICLDPKDGRRVWYMRCATAEDRTVWKAVLKYSASHAEPPLGDDPDAATAFRDAYRGVRRSLGFWGYYRVDKCQQDMLSELCVERCKLLLLTDVFDTLVGQRDEDRIKEAAIAETRRVVEALVKVGWKAINKRANKRRATLGESIGSTLGTTMHDWSSRKQDIRKKVERHVRTAAVEVNKPILGNLLSAYLMPVYRAHKESVRIYWTKMSGILDRGLKERDLRALFEDTRWEDGSLCRALQMIRALTRGEVGTPEKPDPELALCLRDLEVDLPVLLEMMHGVSLWETERVLVASLQESVARAIYSFVDIVEHAPEKMTPEACLHEATRRLIDDCKARAKRDIQKVLLMIVGPAVRRRLVQVPAVQEVLASSAYSATRPLGKVPLGPGAGMDHGSAAKGAASGGASSSSSGAASGSGSGSDIGSSVPAPGAETPMGQLKPGGSTATVERELKARMYEVGVAVSEGFVDADWLLDEVIEEDVMAVLRAGTNETIDLMLSRLSKLPGKLGFL